jgi:hypothetical protein
LTERNAQSSPGKVLLRYSLLGGLLGYLILHPAAMSIMAVTQNPEQLDWGLIGMSFSLAHLPMAIYFVILGIVTGAIFAFFSRRLAAISAKVEFLEGLLPICSVCKKIRSGRPSGDTVPEDNEWVPVEQYVSERSAAVFSHSICPVCVHKLYAEYETEKAKEI